MKEPAVRKQRGTQSLVLGIFYCTSSTQTRQSCGKMFLQNLRKPFFFDFFENIFSSSTTPSFCLKPWNFHRKSALNIFRMRNSEFWAKITARKHLLSYKLETWKFRIFAVQCHWLLRNSTNYVKFVYFTVVHCKHTIVSHFKQRGIDSWTARSSISRFTASQYGNFLIFKGSRCYFN